MQFPERPFWLILLMFHRFSARRSGRSHGVRSVRFGY